MLKLDFTKIRAKEEFEPLPGEIALNTALEQLKEALKEDVWAFTGSYALALWAKKYNVDFRKPNDIDIVLKEFNGSCDKIAGYKNGSVFTIISVGKKNEGHKFKHNCHGFRIDVLFPETRLGSLDDTSFFGGYKVVGITTLLEQLKLKNGSEEDINVANEVFKKTFGK